MITLYHVSCKPRTFLEVKEAVNRDGSIDHKAIYLSTSIKQAVWWAETLSQCRKVAFDYFYKIEVGEDYLFKKASYNTLEHWKGQLAEEVLYIGPRLDNLELINIPNLEEIKEELNKEWEDSFY